MKHNHGEQWALIDTDETNVFTSYDPRMIKCIEGIKCYGDKEHR